MFDVAERQNFVDLIRPPPGYRLEAAIGTTYSLDFVALTAALMAMVDAELAEEERRANPVECLHAITRLSDRVQVFVQRARIASPRQVSRITLLYDRIVEEVQLPNGGSFHPKVWVTYYRPRHTRETEGQPGIVRLICASRNLTTSQNWEAFVAVQGTEGKAKVGEAINSDIATFLNGFTQPAARKARSYRTLLNAIERTRFATAGPLRESARFRWQGHQGAKLSQHLPRTGQRALIVAPFLKASFLRPILTGYERVVVISTQQALDEIDDDIVLARLTAGKNKAYVVTPAESEDIDPVLCLHAKIFVFEGASGRSVFIGSANGTPSAWQARNVEATVQFSPGFSIEHFCDKFIFRERPQEPGGKRELRGWITEYSRQRRHQDEADAALALLDEIRTQIARLDLNAAYDPDGQSLRLSLVKNDVDLIASIAAWMDSCDIAIGPLAELDQRNELQPFGNLVKGDITFAGLALKDITAFFVVRVSHRSTGVEQEFVVKAAATFDREQRDAKLLEALLTRDKLRSFIEAILFDASIRPAESREIDTTKAGENGHARPLLSDLAIEDILRACTEDPTRIEEINRLLRALGQAEVVDAEFRDFWTTFVAAHEEVGRQDAHA